jgi:hypothetical protein
MSHSVIITTPFLSPEEVASRLRVSRQRQREIAEIVGSETASTKRKHALDTTKKAGARAATRKPAISPRNRTVDRARAKG